MTLFPDIRFRFHINYIKNSREKSNIENSVSYELTEDCEVQEENIIIPEGFLTDLSSVPRILWMFIPPYRMAVPASVLHDYMYTYGWKSRKEADELFYKILLTHNVPKWQSFLMYIAVRIFGKSKYKRNDK